MVRTHKRKTERGNDPQQMQAAVEQVRNGYSIRQTAREFGIPYPTLRRYTKKAPENTNFLPNYHNRKIFSVDQEKELEDYLIKSSKMCFGLTTVQCRRLAYQLAKKNSIKIPKNWESQQMAGLDWLQGFKKRNPNIAIRKPEGCSIARATSFNRHNVNMFFNNLETIMQREPQFSDGTRIFNLDETGTTTVPDNLQKVLTQKGIKQACQSTSCERGVLVTTCCCVNAAGNALPPVMIFPRVHFKSFMINEAPPGTLGLATKSGWMTSDLFVQVMEHFVKYSHSSKQNPSLLIYDNHDSHLSIEALDVAKENGVTVLTIPPHTSHKLQPLDVSCFFPFKAFYTNALNSAMLKKPGTPLTIYDVAGCVRIAHERGLNPSNIMSGFKKTGIYPLNRDVFDDSDFLTSEVTDRPKPTPIDDQNEQGSQNHTGETSRCRTPEDNHQPEAITPRLSNQGAFPEMSPHEVVPYPKASDRKTKAGRRKGRTIIATDTPEKKMLEEIRKKKKPIKEKRQLILAEESSEEECNEEFISDASTDEFIMEVDDFEEFDKSVLKINDFVLARLKDNKNKDMFYVAQIINNKNEDGDYEVSYLRKSAKVEGSFVFPMQPDLALLPEADIKIILPAPNYHGQTKRQQSYLSFGVKFGNLDIR